MENSKEETMTTGIIDENAGGDREAIDVINDAEDSGCQATGNDDSTPKDSSGSAVKDNGGSGDGLPDNDQSSKNEDNEKQKKEERVEEIITDKESTKDGDNEEEREEWMDILGYGLLKKKVIKEGKGIDSRPVRGQMVTIRCEGYLENDNKVEEHSSLQFILGDGDVITAFDLAVALMELGEVCTLITDARYAYGELGRKPDIPSDAKLRYELELLKVEDGPDVAVIDSTERLQLGNKKRERGNELYLRGDYSSAINSYTKALNILEAEEGGSNKEEYKDIEEAKLKCHNNLAACQLKVEAYDAALMSCNSVLNVEPDNVKALFRKAKVLACKGEIEEAVADMRKAIKLEPSNKVIHQELSKLVVKHKEQMSSTKDMYKKMVGDMADMATKVKTSEQKSNKSSSKFPSSGILLGATVAALGAVVTAVILALR
ncbi:peptidyl-prolyl cis-trans isomerase FKBP8-like [Glandiceps talaboti]